MRKIERKFLMLAAAVALVALFLRFAGIGYGLPLVFNSDEPFHVNVAVSFGRGSLNPGMFKYPTLWMYTLFGAYGGYFLLWSGFGFLHGVREFGELYVWHPGGFYFIARVLAALFSLAGLCIVYRCGNLVGEEWAVLQRDGRRLGGADGGLERRVGLWAAALLAVSPALIVSAHASKPESQMFFFSALALFFALRYAGGGGRRDLLISGLWVGLAVSTQYTAAPGVSLLPAAWWARHMGKGRRSVARKDWATLIKAAAAAGGGFVLGSPFVLLDWPTFWRDISDQMTVQRMGAPVGLVPLRNAFEFAGLWIVGGFFLCVGAAHLMVRDRRMACMLLAPVAAQIVFLGLSPEGSWQRYMMCSYPALALAAALGVETTAFTLWGRSWRPTPLGRTRAQSGILVLLMLPGAVESWSFNRNVLLRDTRTLATEWAARSIPPGSRVLIDQEHASPRIVKSREQVAELLDRTREAGHPRWRYYDFMLSGHPGGGHEVYQVFRPPDDLHSGEWHVDWSAQGRSVLDVRAGYSAVLKAGIDVVILSSVGATPEGSPRLRKFLLETFKRGRLIKEFRPVRGAVTGPVIKIFDTSRAGAPRRRKGT